MTQNAINKIEGTPFKNSLEYKMKMRRKFRERGLEKEARETQTSIAGYLHALRDAGVITESERHVLYLYYGTV